MVTGTSLTYVAGGDTIDLPRHDPARPLNASHKPWCTDCKRKHEAAELDDAGRCARCARAAASRAAAAARRATAEETERLAQLERKHQAKASSRTTTKLPKEGKQGQPTTRSSAPRATSTSSSPRRARGAGPSTTEKKPSAGTPVGDAPRQDPTEAPSTLAEDLSHLEDTDPDVAAATAGLDDAIARITQPADHADPLNADRELEAQLAHAARALRRSHRIADPVGRLLRHTAITALEALHLHLELTRTPAAATSPATVTAGTRPSSPSSPGLEGHPQTPAAGTGKGKPTRQPAPTTDRAPDPRKIVLPVDAVISAYQAGQTLGQIAAAHGVSHPTVRRCLVENNVPRRQSPVEHTPELVALVRRLYDDEHRTQAEIAEHIGRSTKVVQRLMTEAGVDRRAAQARMAADNARGLKDRMAALNVTSRDVRTWAIAQAIDIPARGLPPRHVVDAYAAAHPAPPQQHPTATTTGDTH